MSRKFHGPLWRDKYFSWPIAIFLGPYFQFAGSTRCSTLFILFAYFDHNIEIVPIDIFNYYLLLIYTELLCLHLHKANSDVGICDTSTFRPYDDDTLIVAPQANVMM